MTKVCGTLEIEGISDCSSVEEVEKCLKYFVKKINEECHQINNTKISFSSLQFNFNYQDTSSNNG